MPADTKQIIADAYISLLEQGGDQIITVKDVVERAGVSRMTFYYHFADIYEMYDWIYGRFFMSELDESLKKTASLKRSEAWRGVLIRLVEILRENEMYVMDNYRHLDPQILDKHMFELLHDMVAKAIDELLMPGIIDETDEETAREIITFTLIGMLKMWVDRDFTFDPVDYIDGVDRFIKNGFKSTIRYSMKNKKRFKESE